MPTLGPRFIYRRRLTLTRIVRLMVSFRRTVRIRIVPTPLVMAAEASGNRPLPCLTPGDPLVYHD